MKYNFQEIEEKWREFWRKNPYFQAKEDTSRKKYYSLDMFPYPSGSGIHLGHWKNYVLSDVYSRIKWHEGYNVLHPMGWDAFGLPAENYAIKQGVHPKISTAKNIETFRRQIECVGAMYDWSKEVDTTDPAYYKWTQWIFLQMFKADLAYEDFMPINWCPSCMTGLANEEVVAGECERCGAQVEQKNVRQWMLRITKYADRLLEDLEGLDWPEKVKTMQKNWIGRSCGARVIFKVGNLELPVFTTRSDTLYGATFVVIAPDHDLIDDLVTDEHREAVRAYQEKVSHMSELDRTAEQKEKTGVFTGSYATNPINGKNVPIYTASYVLKSYGTGIVMAVPAHDQRDFEFATKFGLPIQQVIQPKEGPLPETLTEAYGEDGILINSGPYNGLMAKSKGVEKIVEDLVKKGLAKEKICYRLRDWIFSRQRYWGEPIPLIHCESCGVVPVPEDQLPVELPEVESYEPTGTGESPLADIDWWVNTTCPKCGGPAKRETNTMPQWAGSSWYFLRYPNTELSDKPFSKENMDYWLPVDLYIGGIEHAILHLLYARFYVKVLYDLGYLSFNEPFLKLFNQGMLCMHCDKTGRAEKMSKSKGNVINPDDMLEDFGVDALRLYILFMGPPELDCVWKLEGIRGTKNFLNRLWDFITNSDNIVDTVSPESTKRFHRFLKEYQKRLELFKVNTAVAAVMEYLNDLTGKKLKLTKQMLVQFLTSFSVMAPHFASELLETVAGERLENGVWPEFDESLAALDEIEFAIQVNGKLRGTLTVSKGQSQEELEPQARDAVAKWLEKKTVVKVIFVPDRLVNFVVK